MKEPNVTKSRASLDWWNQDDKDLPSAVTAVVASLWANDADRRSEIERNVRRFGSRDLYGMNQGRRRDRGNLKVNITKSAIETISSKVGKERPRPMLLTYGGDYALTSRCRKLQKWMDGQYYASRFYESLPTVFRDAMICGTGAWHFFKDIGRRKLAVERAFPVELLVDEMDALHGDPRNMHRVKFMDRDVLSAMFPEKAKLIQGLAGVSVGSLPEFLPVRPETPISTRMVMVAESWHRATFNLKGEVMPGKHVITADNVLLSSEDWQYDCFPFEFFHWTKPITGFWGDSAASEIRGMEGECNRLLQSAQKAMELCGNPWVLNPAGGKVKKAKFTDETGIIVEYEGGVSPTVVTHQSVHPEILSQAWTLQQKCYEILGTNEYQTAGVKPKGIEAGVALRQLSEEHLVRFANVMQHFEDVTARGAAEQFLRLGAEMDVVLKAQGKREGYVLRASVKNSAVKLKWSEVAISPDDFFVTKWPTSILPVTPSGRSQAVAEWQQNQWLTPDQAKRLLDFPDLDAVADVAAADQDLLDWQLEQMMQHGKDVLPLQRQDLQKALSWGTLSLEKAIRDGLSDEAVMRVENFLGGCEDLLAAQQPPPTPPMDQMMMGGMPGPAAVGPAPMGPPPMPGVPPGMPMV